MKTPPMKLHAMNSTSARAETVSNFSLTYKCGWRTPGEEAARGGQGVAASFAQVWLPGQAANSNNADCFATFYRGSGYVRLASARS